MGGATAASRACSSTIQPARKSHQRSDEKVASKPACASASTAAPSRPGVQARKRTGRAAVASRVAAISVRQRAGGRRAGASQRKPSMPSAVHARSCCAHHAPMASAQCASSWRNEATSRCDGGRRGSSASPCSARLANQSGWSARSGASVATRSITRSISRPRPRCRQPSASPRSAASAGPPPRAACSRAWSRVTNTLPPAPTAKGGGISTWSKPSEAMRSSRPPHWSSGPCCSGWR